VLEFHFIGSKLREKNFSSKQFLGKYQILKSREAFGDSWKFFICVTLKRKGRIQPWLYNTYTMTTKGDETFIEVPVQVV